MPTLLDIQTAVQRQFGDDTEAQITKEDIARWANEGQLEIARKTDALLKSWSQSTTVSQSDYPLAADFLRVDRVTIDGALLYKTSRHDLDAANPSRSVTPVGTGRPTRFYVKRKTICLYPAPDSVYTLGADVVYRPTVLVSSMDVPQLPVELHNDIVRFCLSRAYELDGQRVESREVMGEFNEDLGWAMDESTNAYSDSYPMIREV